MSVTLERPQGSGSDFREFEEAAVRTFLGARAALPEGIAEDSMSDMNFTGITEAASFRSLTEARAAFVELGEQVPEGISGESMIRFRLGAAPLFIDDIHHLQDGTPRTGYVSAMQSMMGVTPSEVAPEKLQAQREKVEALLEEEKLTYTARGRKAYEDRFVIADKARISEEFNGMINWATEQLFSRFGLEVGDVKPEVVDEDEDYGGFMDLKDGLTVVQINAHHRHKHSIGRIGHTAAHELAGHAGNIHNLVTAVRNGEETTLAAINTLHSAEATQAEAVAQLMAHLLLDNADHEHAPELRLYEAHDRLAEIVFNNAKLKEAEGADDASVYSFIKQELPLWDKGKIVRKMAAPKKEPELRSYSGVYQSAMKLVEPVLAMDQARQREIVRTLYTRALTPDQIKQLVAA